MEPVIPQANFRTVATVLWIALITAIVVTIIDWKIKQDILRITDAFYRVYPSTMESQHEQAKPRDNRHVRPDPVLPFPVVDSNPRVETQDAVSTARKDPEDHSDAWAEFAPELETGLGPRTTQDS